MSIKEYLTKGEDKKNRKRVIIRVDFLFEVKDLYSIEIIELGSWWD